MKNSGKQACCCGDGRSSRNQNEASGDASKAVKDPVCGMTLDPESAKFQAERNGVTSYFCCGGCRVKFLSNPTEFTGREETSLARPSDLLTPNATFTALGG